MMTSYSPPLLVGLTVLTRNLLRIEDTHFTLNRSCCTAYAQRRFQVIIMYMRMLLQGHDHERGGPPSNKPVPPTPLFLRLLLQTPPIRNHAYNHSVVLVFIATKKIYVMYATKRC